MEIRRVILLGASNLTLALPSVVAHLRGSGPGPVDIVAACGHGRSFGIESQALFRRLPGIEACGLWRHLEDLPEAPSQALLMDVGNDLLFGPSVEQIARWVEACLERLRARGCDSVVVRMPTASLGRLPEWRYGLLRRILYPPATKSLVQLREEFDELDGRLGDLCDAFGAAQVESPVSWYGFDPIHIRPRKQREAWAAILGAWSTPTTAAAASSKAEHWRVWRLRPQERWIRGRHQRTAQPVLELADGSTVSLF